MDEHDEAERPKFRVGASAVYTSTAIHFSGDVHADETRSAALATLSYFASSRVSLQSGLGATLGGSLLTGLGRHEFAPGPTGALGASWRVLDGRDARPFVVLTGLLSAEATTTSLEGASGKTGYEAFDLRLGVVTGWTIAKVVSPFVAARAFGGPIYWRYAGLAVTGTDASHFQLGGGVALSIAKRVDVFVEGVPLGEQAISGGIGVAL